MKRKRDKKQKQPWYMRVLAQGMNFLLPLAEEDNDDDDEKEVEERREENRKEEIKRIAPKRYTTKNNGGKKKKKKKNRNGKFSAPKYQETHSPFRRSSIDINTENEKTTMQKLFSKAGRHGLSKEEHGKLKSFLDNSLIETEDSYEFGSKRVPPRSVRRPLTDRYTFYTRTRPHRTPPARFRRPPPLSPFSQVGSPFPIEYGTDMPTPKRGRRYSLKEEDEDSFSSEIKISPIPAKSIDAQRVESAMETWSAPLDLYVSDRTPLTKSRLRKSKEKKKRNREVDNVYGEKDEEEEDDDDEKDIPPGESVTSTIPIISQGKRPRKREIPTSPTWEEKEEKEEKSTFSSELKTKSVDTSVLSFMSPKTSEFPKEENIESGHSIKRARDTSTKSITFQPTTTSFFTTSPTQLQSKSTFFENIGKSESTDKSIDSTNKINDGITIKKKRSFGSDDVNNDKPTASSLSFFKKDTTSSDTTTSGFSFPGTKATPESTTELSPKKVESKTSPPSVGGFFIDNKKTSTTSSTTETITTTTNDEWKCPACETKNTASTTSCSGCFASKPGAKNSFNWTKKKTDTTPTTITITPSTDTKSEEKVETSGEDKKIETTTSIEPKKMTSAASAVGGFMWKKIPNAVPKVFKREEVSESWKCSCGELNANSAECCISCEKSKPKDSSSKSLPKDEPTITKSVSPPKVSFGTSSPSTIGFSTKVNSVSDGPATTTTTTTTTTTDDEWKCPACETKNTASTTSCSGCFASKPGAKNSFNWTKKNIDTTTSITTPSTKKKRSLTNSFTSASSTSGNTTNEGEDKKITDPKLIFSFGKKDETSNTKAPSIDTPGSLKFAFGKKETPLFGTKKNDTVNGIPKTSAAEIFKTTLNTGGRGGGGEDKKDTSTKATSSFGFTFGNSSTVDNKSTEEPKKVLSSSSSITKSVPFGSDNSNVTSFGNTVKSPANLFGSSTKSDGVMEGSGGGGTTFGSGVNTSGFGSSVPKKEPAFTFGSSSGSTSSPSDIFGSSNTPSSTPSFGSSTPSVTPTFGVGAPAGATPAFQFGSSTPTSTPTFGSTTPSTTSTFGSGATQSPATIFGASNGSAATPTFGGQSTAPSSVFGSSTPTSFGSTSSSTVSFGQSAPAPTFGGGGGGGTTTFGSGGGAGNGMFSFTGGATAPSTGGGAPTSFGASPAATPGGFSIGTSKKAPTSGRRIVRGKRRVAR